MLQADSPHGIRWRKGELIGAGAYGRVYMGLNMDSGELLAVKEVLIACNNSTKERAQAHIRELEEEVKLLRNLSHPNIVRYLGTAREEDALNILLEFVPGGSIASLLGKFGSFTEPVIRMYTRQLLLGLEYLHNNKIMHRDIKGANILVDNKGRIKLADFGASKQVLELATISEAKSMKGTPYWMAPEVIRQTGHNWQADIWSVGCTVIEMATGKPPWSQQFQEVAALFHIGTTKSPPPIPDHLSPNAKDFILKCLQRDPKNRPSATVLLQHPFAQSGPSKAQKNISKGISKGMPEYSALEDRYLHSVEEEGDQHSLLANSSVLGTPAEQFGTYATAGNPGVVPEEDFGMSMNSDLYCSVRVDSVRTDCLSESFNPMSDPSFNNPNWSFRSAATATFGPPATTNRYGGDVSLAPNLVSEESLRCTQDEDDDEVTEMKIRAFLDEKALELKRLQTPLFEELYSIWNENGAANENGPAQSFIAPLSPAAIRHNSRSPSKGSTMSARSVGTRSSRDSETSVTSGSPREGSISVVNCVPLLEVDSPRLNEWKGLIHEAQQSPSPSLATSERQKLWEKELLQELEMKREEKRKLSRQASTKEKPSQRLGSRFAGVAPVPR